ncbi:hypothetical protein EVAR_58040_1 [Eumeta japonica]|uniref:Uncharacterized protein n=1 Tax=Eumeta variegata TaxID=151549 RepID=A0A4C1Z1V7_EUMVA|nr:hypothetical protein EVAR_58040_1 [Eumeta japonica]
MRACVLVCVRAFVHACVWEGGIAFQLASRWHWLYRRYCACVIPLFAPQSGDSCLLRVSALGHLLFVFTSWYDSMKLARIETSCSEIGQIRNQLFVRKGIRDIFDILQNDDDSDIEEDTERNETEEAVDDFRAGHEQLDLNDEDIPERSQLPIRTRGWPRSRGADQVVFVRQCVRVQLAVGRGGRTVHNARQIDEANGWSYKPIEHLPENPVFQDLCSKATFERLLEEASDATNKARLEAALMSESGARLHTLLSLNFGILLDDNVLRVAVALRLDCNVCEPHLCISRSTVEVNGYDGLNYQRSSGRLPRHHALNDIIRRALISANVPRTLEPLGLSRSDGKRLAGLTLTPGKKGAV